jgi:hypothetical protein
MLTLRHRLCVGLTALSFGFGALTAHTPEARADEVSPTGKGIVGGALLGGDVVMIVGGIIGVKTPWYYVIGGGLGAIGGGIGGYFVEQAVADSAGGDGHIPVYMLGGGLALIIPALVLTLNATRYQPPADAKEDKAPTNIPNADPGAANGSSVVGGSTGTGGSTTTPTPAPAPTPDATPKGPSSSLTPPPPPQSLVDVHQGAWRMGLPVPMIGAMYSLQTQKEQGVAAGLEVRMPVVRVTF